MLALASTPLGDALVAVLQQERGWKYRQVADVSSEVRSMSHLERGTLRALIVGTEPVNDVTIAAVPNLEVIICLRSEPVNVDLTAASVHGVAVVHTPGRNAESVADFTLGLCLAALRNIAITHHGILSGLLSDTASRPRPRRPLDDVIWKPSDPAAPIPFVTYKGRELSSLVVGVIGFGVVGRAVARRFHGLVREVVVVDPATSSDEVVALGYSPLSLEQMLPTADVVTLHARSASVIIGERELSKMKTGSYLINTARATVLDYEALGRALEEGPLKGAALDVFPEEPLPVSSPLRIQRDLTLTPHLAGATEEVAERQLGIALTGLRGVYQTDSEWDQLPIRNPQIRKDWMSRRRSHPV